MLVFALVVAIAGLWAWFWMGRSVPLAVLGAWVLVLAWVPLLASQCRQAARANARDAQRAAKGGRPALSKGQSELATRAQWLRAWWAEVLLCARVFGWQQPFGSHAVPNHLHDAFGSKGRRGVVFVHGFVCNRGFWNPWMRALMAQRRAFAAVSLEPVFGSIDEYVPLIDEAVNQVEEATGLPPLLVCHSMGGLAARAWMASIASNRRRVDHVVTLGTPHSGTALADGLAARLGWPPNGLQMRRHSDWLQQLQQDEAGQDTDSVTAQAPLEAHLDTAAIGHADLALDGDLPARRRLFTCYHSNCDNIVFPTATAALTGADNRFVPGLAHIELAFDAGIRAEVLREFLRDPKH